MNKTFARKPISILLSLLMLLSVFGGLAFSASAEGEYTITWRNYNGEILETDTVAEGETPTYDGAAPVMGSDPLYTYSWSGWSTEVVPATADATYIAAFDAAPNAEPAADSLVGLKLCMNWVYDFGGAYVQLYSPNSMALTELTGLSYGSYNNTYQPLLTVHGDYNSTYYSQPLTPLDGLTAAGIEITGGTGTQEDPYIMSLIYSKPYVAANGISVAPDWSSAFVVDRVIPVTATLDPKWAVCNVAWSVDGDSIALYADKECTTPVGDATNLSTVYAKGMSVGDAVITATVTANASVTASYNVSVLESDPVIGLKLFKDWIFDLPSDVYYSAVKTTSGSSNWAQKLSGSALTEIKPAYGTDWNLTFRTDNDFWGYYFDITDQTPTGIQIVSGSGVREDPYMMELLYEEAPFVLVDSVSLPSAAKVFEGESVAVTASVNPKAEIENVKPKYADNQQVVWSVDNENVTLYTDAECTTPVGSEATDALTVYAKGVNIGTAAVTAASAENLELTATTKVKVCDLSEKLSVDYELTDSYGWSWDGAKILIREKGSDNVVATLTIDFDYGGEKVTTVTGSAALFKGANYELVWMKGEYDGECSFTITNPFTGEAISASDCSGYANEQVIATLIDPAVEAAKEAAAEALDTYVNADDYRDAQKTELADAIAAGKAAIAATESLDALEEAVTAAQAAIDAIKTAAAYEAEEAAAALADAKAQLSSAVDTAKAFYDILKGNEKYATIADTLDTAIQQGEAMLNSTDVVDILAKAEQVLAVLASVQEQKGVIDAQPDEPTPDEPTPDEPVNEPTNNHKGGFDFISKLFNWLIELFRMFTRWIQK